MTSEEALRRIAEFTGGNYDRTFTWSDVRVPPQLLTRLVLAGKITVAARMGATNVYRLEVPANEGAK